MHTNKLLYFSLDKETRKSFHQYAEKSRAVYEHSFHLVDKNSELSEYGHASDLMVILEHIDQHEDLGHFFVIIDYHSLCCDENKSNKDFDSPQRASDIIRRAILKYPDILFLFDESGAVKKNDSGEEQKDKRVQYIATKYDFSDFLFNCEGIPKDEDYPAPNCIRKELHQFNVRDNSDPFFFISRARDNLFDGSNLRYFVKQFLYNEFRFARRNFRFEQRSRAEHLAFCVEKEVSQNKFNSYALYANGFRVTQVLSAEELKFLNEKCPTDDTNSEKQEVSKSENSGAEDFIEFARPDIIVRDFDLQFNDIDTSIKNANEPKDNSDNRKNDTTSFNINEIDKIRGAKYFDEDSYHKESENNPDKIPIGDSLCKKWTFIEKKNPYWNNLIKPSTYYVADREDNIIINPKIKPSQSGSPCLIDSGEKLGLRGLPKPVSGLYTAFRKFTKVAERVKSIRDEEKKAKEGKEENNKETFSICTKRKGHDHSRALDVYNLAKSMIERADVCYANENYVRAAVIASEAIEVMNGFHTSLTLKAYSIKSKAENAIAIDILGGSEKELCEDACVRIEMIKKDVARLLSSNKGQSINVLSQIYSDCRNYCKEKEHFESEDVFLSAMAELNEGISFKHSEKKDNKDDKKKGLLNYLKEIIDIHKDFFSEKIYDFREKVNSYGSEYGTIERSESERKTKMKNKNNSLICNLCKYLANRKFYIVWFFFVLCLILSAIGLFSHCIWRFYRIGMLIILGCFIIFLFHKPLNVVYGLIGTKGHIRTYLILLVAINVIFSLIYHWGFFRTAGITYDINQPYIAYNMFPDKKGDIKIIHKADEKVPVYNVDDSLVSYWVQPGEDFHFQRINWWNIFKNTLMTSLMQEPSDLFAIASTYTEGVDDFIKGPDDSQKSELFQWLLIFQIFISWIFFGVFISILYNKFRYES